MTEAEKEERKKRWYSVTRKKTHETSIKPIVFCKLIRATPRKTAQNKHTFFGAENKRQSNGGERNPMRQKT